MNIKPLYDNIIVQLAEETNKTASGYLSHLHMTPLKQLLLLQ